ncbi:flippase-like domain-containing protein [Demequina sp. TTPB684]|uniref:lysylphosphatidylglycerol synthase transmembrane domain-containing protein n=1 Tax=unclassified Demequina TaxID=2620311 RepID=UPI001CF26DD6|nr:MULTISPECIES: lysylphosphatidylglycerol synthase transmembrane domain-containing protein [unclassified Demequina]MCB2413425.1 flippase-like domain-containing protein [Demequina sp. TTPB684]UPU87988.1 flippase-like domain-containing protein [Demequina sp. TMPB413]
MAADVPPASPGGARSDSAASSPASSRSKTTPRAVHIVDDPETRVHRMADLISLLGVGLGIVLVLLLGAYAHGTTEGITDDVQGISKVLQRLLVAPVNLFSGIVTLVLPAAVVVDLALRREPRRILEAIGSSAAGFALTVGAVYLAQAVGSDEVVRSLSVGFGDDAEVTLPAYIAGVAALLTVAGRRGTRRTFTISWNILWAALAVAVISGIVTLPAALITVLIGRLAGLGLRYALGSTTDRAYGDSLVEGIERAGFIPKRLVRADPNGEATDEDQDELSTALGRTRHGRVYALTTIENHHLIVVALDADQHAAGFLTKLWSSLRLRGIDARADVSLRHSAEATALVSHAARGAGVHTARVLGMSQARDTMIVIYQRPLSARPLSQFDSAEVTDETVDAVWDQVLKAHKVGISHRSLSADTVMVGHDELVDVPTVWLTSWELGEVATSELAKRIDRAQLVAMLAPIVGADRAVAAAFRALGDEGVEQFAPMLQTIVLPRSTRAALSTSDVDLGGLRKEIVERLPDADVEPDKIARFGLRTVLTIAAGIVAAYLVFASFNTEDVLGALSDSNPWWLLVALGWSMATFFGAAVALMAFSPIKLPWSRALLAQVAAAYLALAAPAGVGPAALNMRLLTRRKVSAPLAVATVALVQVSAVVVTVVGLVTLSLITGSEGTLAALPSSSVLVGVVGTAAVIALAMVVPRVRGWALGRLRPLVRQTWPRLAQVLSQPWRLALGLGGNLLLTIAYVGAFDATLRAFGQDLALIDVTVLFLLGNAAGAIVPTPGGLGVVEGALTAGLISAGLPKEIAASVVVLFRLFSYWARIPLGYLAMRFLQRTGEL